MFFDYFYHAHMLLQGGMWPYWSIIFRI